MRIEDARPIAATRILLALALALATILWVASTSLALEPGVHADPGSPAAKEYALPLNQARQTGSSHGGLFGAGIGRSPARPTPSAGNTQPGDAQQEKPRARARTSAHRAGRLRTGHGDRREAGGGASPADEGTLPTAVQSASRARTTSGGGSLLALIGGGVAVLVLGILGGTVLRGRRSVAARES